MNDQSLRLSIGGVGADIDAGVYANLCDNFIFVERDLAEKYKMQNSLTFKQLRNMCRSNHFSYPLYFAEEKRINGIIKSYNNKIYGKIDEKKSLILGTRDEPRDVRAIRWIIADIIEKQKIYKQYGYNVNLRKGQLVGFLKKSPKSIGEQTKYILQKTGINHEDILSKRSKADALSYLQEKLTSLQIHVYCQAGNAMPQHIPKDFMISGFFVRDNYNPVIFLGNELSLYPSEGTGRKIYTLVFLLVAIFKDYSFVLTLDHGNPTMDDGVKKKLKDIHNITNSILMPEDYLDKLDITTIDHIKEAADKLKVSPTALTVRLSMTQKLDPKKADAIKDVLRKEYNDFIRSKREKDKEKREQTGKSAGPSLKTLCKSYNGDFIDFVRLNVPERNRREIFVSRISYGRQNIKYEDFYG